MRTDRLPKAVSPCPLPTLPASLRAPAEANPNEFAVASTVAGVGDKCFGHAVTVDIVQDDPVIHGVAIIESFQDIRLVPPPSEFEIDQGTSIASVDCRQNAVALGMKPSCFDVPDLVRLKIVEHRQRQVGPIPVIGKAVPVKMLRLAAADNQILTMPVTTEVAKVHVKRVF